MKALVIGIDGGDEKIFDHFNETFYAELKATLHSRKTTEDLFSRGWTEILTGKIGWDNRAFYMSPRLNGTHEFSQSFSISDLYKETNTKNLWDIVGDNGYKVGIMNVPTTTPVVKVNGFLVGSAGGGLGEVKGFPDSLVYPPSVVPTLKKNNYIVDIRFGVSGITEITDLFTKVIEMERRRTETFIQLCKEQNTDFGFLVNTGVRTIQYLAMSEIESVMSKNTDSKEPNERRTQMENLIKELYHQLDLNLRLLVDELKPEHLILTADHGQAPLKYKGNLNVFLEQHGWLTKSSASSDKLIIRLQRLVRKLLPRSLTKSLKKVAPKRIGAQPPKFDTKLTRAFGHFYISGAYINDTRRFGGPVKEGDELSSLVTEICETFNKSPEANTYKMTAKPYRSEHLDASYSDYLPDIIIEKPDSIFFQDTGKELIQPSSVYGPLPEDLSLITSDMYTGTKGRNPIMFMDQKTKSLLKENDPSDLTVVYKLINRIFM